MTTPYLRVLVAAALVLLAPFATARAFTVTDIRVEGLQRISAGTVFNYLPIKVGDEVDETTTAGAIRALFQTGFFTDVRIEREGTTLVAIVAERPSIAEIEFHGNQSIETDALRKALESEGFAERRVFNRGVFEKMKQELREAYFVQGRYGAEVEVTVTPLPRNRVAVRFDITEGDVAKIRRINIVGNDSFDEDDLLELFQLTSGGWLSWLTSSNQYSKQKLSADLEALRSFYLDRGYVNFNIESTQVSITPDRRFVYVTINVDEGERFTVRDVKVAGDLVVDKEELFPMVSVRSGEVFSRREVSRTSASLTERLGREGYAFANVNAVPEIDNEAKQVDLTFFTDPGKRVYVRRIIFRGNTKTKDEVLRREMRQIEGGWISTGALERSRVRLQRLGFFDSVNLETPQVPGSPDQVDVIVTVTERPAGNLLAGLGLSQTQGIVFQTSINQENFLGTGNRVGFTFNNSQVNRAFEFSYLNPYYTLDGVSRGFDLFYRRTDAQDANLADYTTDVGGGSIEFGIPVNEFDSIRLGVQLDYTEFEAQGGASREVLEFEAENPEFFTWRVRSSWARDSRNSRLLPDRGSLTRVSGEVALPGGDLTYYRLGVRHQQFLPLSRHFTAIVEGDVGYGDGYGDTDELPFIVNHFAGGTRSLRGFKTNTLGPRDSNNDPLGGALKTVGTAELILPVPFVTDNRAFRFTGFVDAGNVFDDLGDFDVGEIRVSAGLSAIWLSPFGAITLSLAEPLNEEEGDRVERFQFTFGTSF